VDARTNHGVTSPLWDVVFGTYRAPGTIRVPSRLCMSWLRDERGEVREDFRDTFVLGEP
jgi:sterol desaturase/sphingolipid hydroxylase (fatty acid hydroxylase superfamily)